MLNICANIRWLFREHDFVDRFAAAGDAGFAGVQFGGRGRQARRVQLTDRPAFRRITTPGSSLVN